MRLGFCGSFFKTGNQISTNCFGGLIAAHYLPDVEHVLIQFSWQAPAAVFVGLMVYRFFLAPFLLHQKQDRRIEFLQAGRGEPPVHLTEAFHRLITHTDDCIRLLRKRFYQTDRAVSLLSDFWCVEDLFSAMDVLESLMPTDELQDAARLAAVGFRKTWAEGDGEGCAQRVQESLREYKRNVQVLVGNIR